MGCNCLSCFNARVRKYVFWTLIAVLTALTINDVVSLLGEYFENPKVADMGYVFNETMKFPVFTVCIPTPMVLSIFNSNMFNKPDNMTSEEAIKGDLKKMKTSSDFLNMDWDWRTVEDAYTTIAQIHTFERETDDSFVADQLHKLQKRDKQTKVLQKFQHWHNIIQKREVTFKQFMQKTGEEVLNRMIKKAERSSLDSDDVFKPEYKVTWISEPNLCFQPTFSGNASGMITAQGNFFFMKIGHDFRKLDHPLNIVVDMNGRQANMAYFADSGGHTTEGVSSGVQAGTISDLQVEVRSVYELLENSDPGTKCIDLDNDDSSDNDGEFYPVFQCRGRCRTELMRELCHCTPISGEDLIEDKSELELHPICDYSKCKTGNNTEKMSEKLCSQKCKHGCTMTRYSIKQLSNNPAIILNSKTHQPMQAPNQTSFFLTWGSFEFLKMEQCYKYETLVQFLSELGGSLGIWLGLSVLSLLQGSAFVTEKLTDKAKNLRKRGNNNPGDPSDPKPPPKNSSFSQNPFGGAKVSENPFSGVMSSGEPRKRNTKQ